MTKRYSQKSNRMLLELLYYSLLQFFLTLEGYGLYLGKALRLLHVSWFYMPTY